MGAEEKKLSDSYEVAVVEPTHFVAFITDLATIFPSSIALITTTYFNGKNVIDWLVNEFMFS